MITEKNNSKVVVGLSGGVDSATACYLLKQKGFVVLPVFLKIKDDREEESRAFRVASKLGVELTVRDVREQFQERVVQYFLKEVAEGRTPNPCVVCNREIKFRILLEELEKVSGDAVATGHYIIKSEEERGVVIKKGVDSNKDQSYFLWSIKKDSLRRVIFPLGEITKEEVKKIAQREGFAGSTGKESQDFCFADKVDVLLKEKASFNEGEIVNKEGVVIGKHHGLCYYTAGQRKGLGLSGGPYYVLKKDLKSNRLTVTKDEEDLLVAGISYHQENFLQHISLPFTAKVKVRYRGKDAVATVEKERVIFHSPQRAVATGQSVVFYHNNELVGGGVIKSLIVK